MLWVTRSRIRVNRTATSWMIRRFVDPQAAFRFVEPADVAGIQRAEGAIGFDAPGARYPHKDGAGRCSFEALVAEYCWADHALRQLARIIHDADFPDERRGLALRPSLHRLRAFDVISPFISLPSSQAIATPEAEGLRAISAGFPLVTSNDHETVERAAFLYDALYASLSGRS